MSDMEKPEDARAAPALRPAIPGHAVPYRPKRAILELGAGFWDVVRPAPFPEHLLRFRNDDAAASVGLGQLTKAQWIGHFGRFEPLPDNLNLALAMRYHGHQFHIYNPELGDGRGFLYAQLLDGGGRLLDLGTKGSGKTPWSRFGDGRLTLKGGVREVLAAEMLQALGVPTSRALSLIETGERLYRNDEPSPTRSSVLVRLSHSHIRYGTFQRLAALEEPALMTKLMHYVLRHLAHRAAGADSSPWAALMDYAVQGAAGLAAAWHVACFVHGVLNTDNSNITGESFDYGPWRFLPRYDARFTAAYFDESGLFAFGRQAEALQWNLVALAKALRLVAPAASLLPALNRYPALLEEAVHRRFLWRLGLRRQSRAAEEELLRLFEHGLAASGMAPDQAWFRFRGGRAPADCPPALRPFQQALARFAPRKDALSHPYWDDPGPVTLLYEDVEALWQRIAVDDDWSAFAAKIAAIRRMGAAYRLLSARFVGAS